jgi:integrase
MRYKRVSLRFEQWPAPDRQIWEAATTPAELFDSVGVAAGWSDATRTKVISGYGRWLGWLAANEALDPAALPGERVTKARVTDYLIYLKAGCGSFAIRSYVEDLYNAMRVLAPTGDWNWLCRLVMTLRARATPVRDKRARLRSPVDVIELGERMMRGAEQAEAWSEQKRAVHFRDGLLIAFLASRPVRARNLASMRIGRHIIERNGSFWITFKGEETKDGRPYEAILPNTLAPYLRKYLDIYRVILLRGKTLVGPSCIDAFWVSETGTHLTQVALGGRISKHTKAEFGQSMSPHLFRDAVATEIAIHNPGHVDDACQLLGHATLATTKRHYIQANTLVASRRYGELLQVQGRPAPYAQHDSTSVRGSK